MTTEKPEVQDAPDDAQKAQDGADAAPPDGEDGKTPASEGASEARSVLDLADSDDENGTTGDKWAEIRKAVAGDDEKMAAHLGRYASMENALKAGYAAQSKIRSGEVTKGLPDDATEKQVAEYREANGIPAEPSGYDLSGVEGVKFSEDDKEMVDSFLSRLHAKNARPEIVQEVVAWYGETLAANNEAQETLDNEDYKATNDTLKGELGGQFKPSMSLALRLLQDSNEGFGAIGDQLVDARLPDGRKLVNVPEFMSRIVQLARDTYGDAGFAGGDAAAGGESRLKELRDMMKKDPEAYYGKGHDKEYAELLSRTSKSGRTAA